MPGAWVVGRCRHRLRQAVFVVAVLALPGVAGCAVWDGSGSSGSSATAARLAPPIPAGEALDLGRYAARPCDFLRPDRTVQLHLQPPGVAVAGPAGMVCRWDATEKGRPAIAVGAEIGQGLEPLYQRRGGFGFFEPVRITGYPGAHTTDPGQHPRDGVCTTRVGVADDTLLSVTADYDGAQHAHPSFSSDPCPDADKIAEEIVNHVRAANP